MKAIATLLLALLASTALTAQTERVVSRDNGSDSSIYTIVNAEESVMLKPEGPCRVVALEIYFASPRAGSDTMWVVGDPAEGAVPPTSWVWHYNTLAPPFVIEYDGTPGWKRYDLRAMNIRSDGHDRIVVQHRIDQGGLSWVFDDDGQTIPYGSFLMNPRVNNSLGFPGQYYLAGGDFMVRLVVEYDHPSATGSQPQPTASWVDVTSAAGLVGPTGAGVPSSRVSVADWNGDGWDDVAAGSTFWQNDGDGTFSIVNLGISASTTVWGDYDNDGDLDCYAAHGGTTNDILYRNDGEGIFTDVTAEAGIANPAPTITPIWLDMENDGDLDLFISNGRTGDYPNEIFYQDMLWMNNGDGTFTDVTPGSGFTSGEPSPYYDAWGAAAGDYNGDGWTDIFVATYRLAPDLLYRNDAGNGFTNVGPATGVRGEPTAEPSYFGHGIGAEFVDFNNDAAMDIMVGNLGHPDWRGRVSNPSLLYRNDGAPSFDFTEVGHDLGVKFFEMNAGVVWGDFNLDGAQDLFHCQYSYQAEGDDGEPARLSRLYISEGAEGGWKLRDRTWQTGLRVHGAWTAARLDYDRDGDLDLVVATPHEKLTLFGNELGKNGRSLVFRLYGDPSLGMPVDGYGSRITVYDNGETYVRELAGGGTGATGSQNTNALHFGVGEVETVDSVILEWGGSIRRVYRDVVADREYQIRINAEEELSLVRTLGVEDRRESHPSSDIMGLRYDGDAIRFQLDRSRAGRVELVDATGRVVVYAELESQSYQRMPVPAGLASGVYFVRVVVSDGLIVEKIVVE